MGYPKIKNYKKSHYSIPIIVLLLKNPSKISYLDFQLIFLIKLQIWISNFRVKFAFPIPILQISHEHWKSKFEVLLKISIGNPNTKFSKYELQNGS